MSARQKKNNERAPFASPQITLLLLGLLFFVLIAYLVEGNFPSGTDETAPAKGTQSANGGKGFALHALNVGKADCLLLLCDGEAMLVDGGNEQDGEYILDYLNRQGVKKLKYLINTHPHKDHLGALKQVLLSLPVEQACISPVPNTTELYEELLLALDAQNVPLLIPSPGNTMQLGSAKLTFLSPAPDADFGQEINDWSLVFLLEYGKHRFLFMGDAESNAEGSLLESGAELSCDVLKVAHHGDNSSSKAKFLNAAMPTYAIITCDEDENGGAPDKKVLDRLHERNVHVLRTDKLGDIVLLSDGETLSVPLT